MNELSQLTRVQWRDIHPRLGIPREWMTKTGKPCLMCGGHDRSSYDDKDGRGTYLCRQCGAGDGFTLLQRYHGWTFKQTADEVRRVLGETRPERLPTPPRAPVRKPPKTQALALRLWDAASPDDTKVSMHRYAHAKGIRSACAARRGIATGSLVGNTADCLLVPSRDATGTVIGIQAINPEGVKQSYGSLGELILGNDLDPSLPIVVLEGWASCCAYLYSREWNGCAVVSFGKGRQEKVACDIESRYPEHKVVILEEVD